jgi:hypothetical protein
LAELEEIESREPPVDFHVQMAEIEERLMALLRDDTLREIARRTMDGETAVEMARHFKVVPRTVFRKQALIRTKWAEALDGDSK